MGFHHFLTGRESGTGLEPFPSAHETPRHSAASGQTVTAARRPCVSLPALLLAEAGSGGPRRVQGGRGGRCEGAGAAPRASGKRLRSRRKCPRARGRRGQAATLHALPLGPLPVSSLTTPHRQGRSPRYCLCHSSRAAETQACLRKALRHVGTRVTKLLVRHRPSQAGAVAGARTPTVWKRGDLFPNVNNTTFS